MADPKPIIVTSIPRSFMTEDASMVQVHFSRLSGEPLVLQIGANHFPRIVSRLTELLAGLTIRRGTKAGHLEIPAANAQAVTAQAPVGGGKVILSLRTDNGLMHHFALSPDQTEAIRAELAEAETKARDEGGQTRQ